MKVRVAPCIVSALLEVDEHESGVEIEMNDQHHRQWKAFLKTKAAMEASLLRLYERQLARQRRYADLEEAFGEKRTPEPEHKFTIS
jgi:hypothetical protein